MNVFMNHTMEKAERRRRHYMRIVIVQAVFVTVAAHFLLLLLFRYQSQKTVAPSEGRAGIRLFNLAANSPERQQKIRNWLDVHDPSLIARADSPHSAVARLLPTPHPTVPDLERGDATPELPERQVPQPVALKVAGESLPLPSQEYSEKMAPDALRFPALSITDFPRILVNGKRVALPVSDEMKSLSRAVNADRTVVELRTDDAGGAGDSRFLVTHSSGSSRLDMLAVRMLLANRERFPGKGTQKIVILWQMQGAK